MKQWVKHFMASGELFIWGCGAGLSISLLMIGGLLVAVVACAASRDEAGSRR